MLPDYDDIRALTDQPPLWFGEHGEPRYRAFDPEMLGVYDHYAVLVEIGCQGCSGRFLVGVGRPRYSFWWGHADPVQHTLASLCDGFHYGDPPRHGGCVGETMNCEDLRVIEAWEQETVGDWQRVPSLEGVLS